MSRGPNKEASLVLFSNTSRITSFFALMSFPLFFIVNWAITQKASGKIVSTVLSQPFSVTTAKRMWLWFSSIYFKYISLYISLVEVLTRAFCVRGGKVTHFSWGHSRGRITAVSFTLKYLEIRHAKSVSWFKRRPKSAVCLNSVNIRFIGTVFVEWIELIVNMPHSMAL